MSYIRDNLPQGPYRELNGYFENVENLLFLPLDPLFVFTKMKGIPTHDILEVYRDHGYMKLHRLALRFGRSDSDFKLLVRLNGDTKRIDLSAYFESRYGKGRATPDRIGNLVQLLNRSGFNATPKRNHGTWNLHSCHVKYNSSNCKRLVKLIQSFVTKEWFK